MTTFTTQIPLKAEVLPYAGWSKAVTAVYRFFAGLRSLSHSLDQAVTAAEVSRDLYAATTSALAAQGITIEQVPDYVARKLIPVAGYRRVANDDAKRLPAA
jgi:hypothetical protein